MSKGPRMTITDVMKDMRSRGMPMTFNTIANCIKTGVFPFGHILNTGSSGRTTYLIFRKDYEAWADEFLTS